MAGVIASGGRGQSGGSGGGGAAAELTVPTSDHLKEEFMALYSADYDVTRET